MGLLRNRPLLIAKVDICLVRLRRNLATLSVGHRAPARVPVKRSWQTVGRAVKLRAPRIRVARSISERESRIDPRMLEQYCGYPSQGRAVNLLVSGWTAERPPRVRHAGRASLEHRSRPGPQVALHLGHQAVLIPNVGEIRRNVVDPLRGYA